MPLFTPVDVDILRDFIITKVLRLYLMAQSLVQVWRELRKLAARMPMDRLIREGILPEDVMKQESTIHKVFWRFLGFRPLTSSEAWTLFPEHFRTPMLYFSENVSERAYRVLERARELGLVRTEDLMGALRGEELGGMEISELMRSYVNLVHEMLHSRCPAMATVLALRVAAPEHAEEYLGLSRREYARLARALEAQAYANLGRRTLYAYVAEGLGDAMLDLCWAVYKGLVGLHADVSMALGIRIDPEQEVRRWMLESLAELGWSPPACLIDYYYALRRRRPDLWKGVFVINIRGDRISSIQNAETEDGFHRVIRKEYEVAVDEFIDDIMPLVMVGGAELVYREERGAQLLKIVLRSPELIDRLRSAA